MNLTGFKPQSKRTTAVLACGGRSTRMGENKLLIDICGKSCIKRSAEAVLSSPDVVKLVVAAPRELWVDYRQELFGIPLPIEFAEAGSTRAESVKNAAELALGDLILIHDGARPLVTPREVQASIDDAYLNLSSVICTPVKDTIRYFDGEKSCSPERSCLYTVRTPQTFSLKLYRYALERAEGGYTDDAQLLDALGIVPHITIGEYTNIKLTTREDIAAARSMVSEAT